jgi:hypothetical protein
MLSILVRAMAVMRFASCFAAAETAPDFSGLLARVAAAVNGDSLWNVDTGRHRASRRY